MWLSVQQPGWQAGPTIDDSFYASAFTAAALAGTASATQNPILGATISAAIGGTASELSGGKFANGAVSGAFQYAAASLMAPPADDGSSTAAVELEVEQVRALTTFDPNGEYYAVGVDIFTGGSGAFDFNH